MFLQVRSKLTDMLTIYAGPFEEGFCLHSVKKEFERCGPIQSLTVVTEPYKVKSAQSIKLADGQGRVGSSNLLEKYGLEPLKYLLLHLVWGFFFSWWLRHQLQQFRISNVVARNYKNKQSSHGFTVLLNTGEL